jgi:predicted nucleic acid-binding protein
MIVDTDVLIWYLRGNLNAFNAIEELDGFSVSVVTYMELVQGMRNREELEKLRRALGTWNTVILHITEEISAKAMFLVEQYHLSHSIHLADALIGATAISHGLTLLTGNDKHYKVMKGVKVRRFRP